jgi:hypothetical protein
LTDAQQVIADMRIGYTNQSAADQQAADQQAADLTIVGRADHADRRYRVDEPITLSVAVDKAAYVAVLRVMPNGAATLIFPNRQQPSAPVPPGAPLQIPAAAAPFALTADKPGPVLFEFIAAGRAGSWLFSRKPEGTAAFVELGTTTRALARDIVMSLGRGRGGTAASHLILRVAAR